MAAIIKMFALPAGANPWRSHRTRYGARRVLA
jgi:hypothetical protein